MLEFIWLGATGLNKLLGAVITNEKVVIKSKEVADKLLQENLIKEVAVEASKPNKSKKAKED